MRSALAPRKVPRQQRARETVERVLDSTAELLDEVGFDAITTNLIAEHSGTNVASLYSYFPNKFAVMAALWERMQSKFRALAERLIVESPIEGDFYALVDVALDAYARLLVREPGLFELSRAMRRAPELQELAEADRARTVRLLTEILPARGDFDLSRDDMRAIAPVLVETASAIWPLVRAAGPKLRKRYLREFKLMLVSYLENYRTST